MTTKEKSLEELEREFARRCASDFLFYAKNCLKIRTKSGATKPFVLNRSQRFLHAAIEDQIKRTGRARKIVLKGRQTGCSTYVAARNYYKTTHNLGFRTFILAHLDDATDNLFNMAKRFHDNTPEVVRPTTGASNAKELVFPKLDSGYVVATAGNKSVGRSHTLQIFHGTEVAYWPNAEEHTAGIMQAIADAPGTEVILESTANGISNAFHSLWKAAERGEGDLECVFIPWFWHEEYERDVPEQWKPPQAWADYGDAYKLDPRQVYWAYVRNAELARVAGGTPDEPCWRFNREYPANASDAFTSSGDDSFISAEKVIKARKAGVTGYGPMVIGIDPARGGKDKTGIIDRRGRRLGGFVCKRLDYGEDLMPVVGEVVRLVKDARAKALPLKKVIIDITGLGAGLYDRLREVLGDDLVEGVNFSERALNTEKYANRRAEMWDRMREWFEDPAGVQVPDSDDFQGDVCAPIRGGSSATHFKSNGQLVLEAKDNIKKRIGYSPDEGDASALTFAVDYDQLTEPDNKWNTESTKSHGGLGWMM
jgi:hypothetical protein